MEQICSCSHGLTSPLHVACQEDHVECADILIKYGANINALDSKSATPLHASCFSGSVLCMVLLLKMGADINTPQSPSTPLHQSCFQDKNTMCRYANKIWSKCKYYEEIY
ncbi:hypothetical protein CEXT_480041 [Caerostris extrusa]|uniref:Uncharacterized protein n=1 Tax=Caerostris extrusa TaxID=172846 RepID=A0AAV4RNP6_CAEEX|nr:hypothetical protein CEXT_480041 [Caerostris extrusa]